MAKSTRRDEYRRYSKKDHGKTKDKWGQAAPSRATTLASASPRQKMWEAGKIPAPH